MTQYLQALADAMAALSDDRRVVFVGQSVAYPGQRAHATFAGIPTKRRIEMPIAEDFQVGFCTGLALAGYVPVCFIPRIDFLIVAASAIVNHLDVLPGMGYQPHVIIRTAVGASAPLDPGPQHTRDHGPAFRRMCRTVKVVDVTEADDVAPLYKTALDRPGAYIMVERIAFY